MRSSAAFRGASEESPGSRTFQVSTEHRNQHDTAELPLNMQPCLQPFHFRQVWTRVTAMDGSRTTRSHSSKRLLSALLSVCPSPSYQINVQHPLARVTWLQHPGPFMHVGRSSVSGVNGRIFDCPPHPRHVSAQAAAPRVPSVFGRTPNPTHHCRRFLHLHLCSTATLVRSIGRLNRNSEHPPSKDVH